MSQDFKARAREMVQRAAEGSGRLKEAVVIAAKQVDSKREVIADHADTIAKASKVAAGVAVAGAVVAAPTGLAAAGVAIGVVSAPLIVTAAPVLAGAAGVAMTVSAGASLYSKLRRRRDEKAAVRSQSSQTSDQV